MNVSHHLRRVCLTQPVIYWPGGDAPQCAGVVVAVRDYGNLANVRVWGPTGETHTYEDVALKHLFCPGADVYDEHGNLTAEGVSE